MPAVNGAGTPSRSQIEAWDTAHLETAATHWTSAAAQWEEHYAAIHTGTLAPGGSVWEGTAAETAQERAWADLVTVRGLTECLHDASAAARSGAEDISWAKRQVLGAISDAEANNFTVGEDLSVTPPSASSPFARVPIAEAVAAQEYATQIASAAKALAMMDQQVAGKITGALAPLQGASFGEDSGERAPVMQAMGNKFKTDIEEDDQDPFYRHDNEPRTPIGPAVDPDTGAREPVGTGPGSGAGMPPVRIPQAAHDVLNQIDAGKWPGAAKAPGTKGGSVYENAAPPGKPPTLPATDSSGNHVTYREWDVNPKVPGQDRGEERIVTGSDGSAWYTNDHYDTFQRMR